MISISIIISVYNVEPYVRRCLESVVAQNCDEADVECIIIDDCGQDNSMAIARQVVEEYQGTIRFVILVHEQNRGLSVARNTGLSEASGDYVMFVDSDDYLLLGSLQYFVDMQREYPSADMIMGNVKRCKNGDSLIHHLIEPCLLDNPDIFVSRMFQHKIYLYAWNKLIRRSVLIQNNILFEDGILYEDQLWSYQLFNCLSSVLMLPRTTYVYENNPNSIVNTTFTQEKADKIVWSYTVSCNKMLDTPPEAKRYNKNIMVDYLLFVMNFLMNGVDVMTHQPVGKETLKGFRKVRQRLLLCSLKNSRLFLSCFFLFLFPPFSHLQSSRFFRHHYYVIESVVNRLAHLTDFLHPSFANPSQKKS